MTIWDFQRAVSGRLATWAAVSATIGGFLLLARGERRAFWHGVGVQAIGWAVINFAIALFGQRAGAARERSPGAQLPYTLAKESRGLFRLLWINAGLDILYMLGGWSWARRSRDERGRGHGIGIVIQGAFLFVFDVIHGLLVPRHDR